MKFSGWAVLAALVAFVLGAAVLAVRAMTVVGANGTPTETASMSWHGILALTLGIVGTVALAAVLIALVLYSNRSGHDDRVDQEARRRLPDGDPR